MSLEHYQFHLIVAKYTNAVQVSGTLEFSHHYLTQQTYTHTDRILHSINTHSCALTDSPTVACDEQLVSIT